MNTMLLYLFSFVACLGLALLAFRKERGRVLSAMCLWVLGALIAACFVLEAPYSLQNDDYAHYVYARYALTGDADIQELARNYSHKNYSFIFQAPLKLLPLTFDSLITYSKSLYLLLGPLAFMCSWLVHGHRNAALATGLFFTLSPLFIRFAGGVTLILPACLLFLTAFLFLLLFLRRGHFAYLLVSCPAIIVCAMSKTENFIYLATYILLALVLSPAGRPGENKNNLSPLATAMLFLTATAAAAFILKPELLTGNAEILLRAAGERNAKQLGTGPLDFLSRLAFHSWYHLVIVPPAIIFKILMVRSWFVKKDRALCIILSLQFFLFFTVYAFSNKQAGLNHFRHAMNMAAPLYFIAGAAVAGCDLKSLPMKIAGALLVANLIPHYVYIHQFKETPKYREYTFLKENPRGGRDCTIVYNDYPIKDYSPLYAMLARTGSVDSAPIQNFVSPGSSLDRELVFFALRVKTFNRMPPAKVSTLPRGALYDTEAFTAALESGAITVHPDDMDARARLYMDALKTGATADSLRAAGPVWNRDFLHALEQKKCYLMFFDRMLIEKNMGSHLSEMFTMITPHLAFEKSSGSEPPAFKRINGVVPQGRE